LEEEISEIQAMYAHVEDQMISITEEIEHLSRKVNSFDKKKQQALSNGKMSQAQKIVVEVMAELFYIQPIFQAGIVSGDIELRKNQIKDFHRKKYFLEQEINRRKGLVKVIENEIKATMRQQQVKNRLVKKAKKEVFIVSLRIFT
jgi:hypothetical protein